MSADSRAPAYFDSSVLVKRYVTESGASIARRLFVDYRILSCRLTPLEITSAIRRRHTEGELSPMQFVDILKSLGDDQSHWELAELDRSVLVHAQQLLRSTQVRALDAIHISSASSLRIALGVDLPFITADARQRTAATALGLDVVWVK